MKKVKEWISYAFHCQLKAKLFISVIIAFLSISDDYFEGCSSSGIVSGLFLSFIAAFIIWSVSSTIFMQVNKYESWIENPLRKIAKLIAYNLLFIIPFMTVFIYLVFTYKMGRKLEFKDLLEEYIFTITITTIVNLVFSFIDIYMDWKKSYFEIEKLKEENLRSQLESLKNQINPHFLFNSLNTLISIIDEDAPTAKNYVQHLSQVYRYILQSREKELVSLQEELHFVDSYFYLLSIRFGSNIQLNKHVEATFLQFKLPSLVCQVLLENCIKHNVVSSSRPLHIDMYIEENKLVVKNNFQPKMNMVDSNKVGLKNINERYQLLSLHSIDIIKNTDHFEVRLPLITA